MDTKKDFSMFSGTDISPISDVPLMKFEKPPIRYPKSLLEDPLAGLDVDDFFGGGSGFIDPNEPYIDLPPGWPGGNKYATDPPNPLDYSEIPPVKWRNREFNLDPLRRDILWTDPYGDNDGDEDPPTTGGGSEGPVFVDAVTTTAGTQWCNEAQKKLIQDAYKYLMERYKNQLLMYEGLYECLQKAWKTIHIGCVRHNVENYGGITFRQRNIGSHAKIYDYWLREVETKSIDDLSKWILSCLIKECGGTFLDVMAIAGWDDPQYWWYLVESDSDIYEDVDPRQGKTGKIKVGKWVFWNENEKEVIVYMTTQNYPRIRINWP